MLGEKTAQKVLFVWMIFLFLLSARLLLTTRAGVLLGSLVIAGLTLWVTFRMVEHLVAGAWKVSGAVASSAESQAGRGARSGPEGFGE